MIRIWPASLCDVLRTFLNPPTPAGGQASSGPVPSADVPEAGTVPPAGSAAWIAAATGHERVRRLLYGYWVIVQERKQ